MQEFPLHSEYHRRCSALGIETAQCSHLPVVMLRLWILYPGTLLLPHHWQCSLGPAMRRKPSVCLSFEAVVG